jgi:hypothetical protein
MVNLVGIQRGGGFRRSFPTSMISLGMDLWVHTLIAEALSGDQPAVGGNDPRSR